MPVVAAGMHFAVDPTSVSKLVQFQQVERVEIRAQADLALRRPRLENADNTRLGQPLMHFETEFAQLLGDNLGCALLFEGGFRVGVDIVPPGNHILVKIGNSIVDGH